jgi:D-3-phosphoglycerate dehydrogenase
MRLVSTSPSFGRFADEPKRYLEDAGCIVDLVDAADADAVAAALAGADAWLVGSEPVGEAQLTTADALRVIAKSGAGTDNLDLQLLESRGISVVTVPAANSAAVAEFALAQLLAIARRLPDADAAVRAGEWRPLVGRSLGGRVLGIVGFGAIGQRLGVMAQAVGMEVVVHSRSADAATAEKHGVGVVDLPTLLATSDAIALCVPLTAETRGLIGPDQLAAMRPGVLLVNVARGGVVDEAALATALNEGRVGAAAIDVFADEPPGAQHPLLSAPNVLLSPHSASYGDLVLRDVGFAVARAILEALRR